MTNEILVSQMDLCEVPMWQMLKSQLNNLTYSGFMKSFDCDQGAICIDVRTVEEYNSGHIPGAINLDYLSHNLADQLEALDPKPSYYIYCRTGRRSLRVCVILKNLGFQHVTNLDSGIANESAFSTSATM